ncbi:MAG: hypothetical protein JSR63_05755, partial [Proteobacteria bacterium]|nr:hypothetical protein [Pseudomonadota bacterium]
LQALPVVFECLSNNLINYNESNLDKVSAKELFGLSFLNLCRRAYSLKSEKVYGDIKQESQNRLTSLCSFEHDQAINQVDSILNSLTLNQESRSVVGLWSRGPRFPIMKIPCGYIFDFYGIHRYFHNIFVGVKEQNTDRGYVFEDAFRSALIDAGLKLEQRDFTFHDGTKAEADAVFYLGTRLVVVDCLSVWRPLDFDIARPATMARRQALIEEKITKSLNRVAKIQRNPTGRNFDFTRATEFITLVATPFTEWLWDKSDRLWYDTVTPRVMRANELIDWAVSQASN